MVNIGQVYKIIRYQQNINPILKRKLLSFGLTPTTEFEVIRKAPCGDPIQIKVRGMNLMLRQSELDCLIYEILPNIKK